MVALYTSVYPTYGALARETGTDELLRVVGRGVDESLAILTGDMSPQVDPDDPIVSPLERHAALGIPLAEVVEAISHGGPLVWQAILEAAQPDELDGLAQAATRWQRYLQAGAHARGVVERDGEAGARVLFELLVAEQPPARVLIDAGRRAGVDLRDGSFEPVVMLARSHSSAVLARRAGELREAGHAAVLREDVVLALLSPEHASTLAVPVRTLAMIGRASQLAGLHGAIVETQRLARLALAAGREGMLHSDDLAREVLSSHVMLQNSPCLVADLRARVVEPLRCHDARSHTDLVGTLVAYVKHDFQLGRAAAAMHLHPNSMRSRLERITQLTGVCTSCSQDRLTLTLASCVAEGERR